MAARAVNLISLLWAVCAVLTRAFDIDAHDAVGQTTASAMDQVAVRGMKRLLGGQDASDVAGWGHQVDDTYPAVERLHFELHDDTNAPFCGPAESRISKCDDNICLLSAIKHFYGKVLGDEGRVIEYPKIDYGKLDKGLKFTDADSVKMLINLIGDLHQPMHLGFIGDDHGKKVQVKWNGKQMSLYDFWDSGISETVRNQESNFWLGGWTHIRAISGEFTKDKELWKSEGAFKSFERWEAESVQMACDKAYTNPVTGNKLAGPGAHQGVIEITPQIYQVWREAWLRQILLAGERTAIVLNDILDAVGAKKLQEGSGVRTKADEVAEKEKEEWAKEREERMKNDKYYRAAPASMNVRVMMTNLSIAAFIVPMFLLVSNYGFKPETYKALIQRLTSGSDARSAENEKSSRKRFE